MATRPAGLSDSDSEDDFGGGSVVTPKSQKPQDNPQSVVNRPAFESGYHHQSSHQSQPVPPGVGRGRGRGRGNWSQSSASGNSGLQCHGYSPQVVPSFTQAKDKKGIWLNKITGVNGIDKGFAIRTSFVIQSAWKTHTNEEYRCKLRKTFENCISEGRNVFAFGLYCVMDSFDFSFDKPIGPYSSSVVYGLRDFVTSQKISAASMMELQDVAVDLAMFLKPPLQKALIETFDLANSNQNNRLIPCIQALCSKKNYREAVTLASLLKLEDQFDVHAFLVPLLLQDKYTLVEEFVKDCVPLQRNLVTFFDDLYAHGPNGVSEQLHYYVEKNEIPEVKRDKMNPKPITKLVKRLATRFNIGYDYYPNVGNRQKFGELRFLFSRRYEKQEMNAESFEELVNEIAEGSNKLQEEVVSHFLMYGDSKAAAKFIVSNKLFSSSACSHHEVLSFIPEPHRSKLENTFKVQHTPAPVEDENWDEDDGGLQNNVKPNNSPHATAPTHQKLDYHVEENWDEVPANATDQGRSEINELIRKAPYRCHLSVDDIEILDTPDKILEVCKWLDERVDGSNCLLSGFDSEWKPIASKRHGAALLQIAFEEKIYIVDIPALLNNDEAEESHHWLVFYNCYFKNEKIFKFGFDIKNDMKMLKDTIPEWSELGESCKSVIDLSSIRCLILKEDPAFFDSLGKPSSSETGLCELVSRCLGKHLSKEEQMSDWEKRPLRTSQIVYAANDAYCLIDVFKALKSIAETRSINFEKLVQDYLKGCVNASTKKRKYSYLDTVLELMELQRQGSLSKNNAEAGFNHSVEDNDTSSLQLVVDNMLQGLGRYLRVLGFDTVILKNTQRHEVCCEYAKNGRIVITKGAAYYEITSTVPEDRVFSVKSDVIIDQLQEICQRFNIQLFPSRLFSICQKCNRSEFVKVSKDKMNRLLDASGVTKRLKIDEANMKAFKEKAPDDMILSIGDILKSWELFDENNLFIFENGQVVETKYGVAVQLKRLQFFSNVIDCVYVCNYCGTCYWESSKMESVLKNSVQGFFQNDCSNGK